MLSAVERRAEMRSAEGMGAVRMTLRHKPIPDEAKVGTIGVTVTVTVTVQDSALVVQGRGGGGGCSHNVRVLHMVRTLCEHPSFYSP